VTQVNTEKIEVLVTAGIVPVVSPIASDSTGTIGYNVNADLVAAAIAGALDAESLIVMTDVEGIYRNWPDRDSLISTISASELSKIKSTFAQGMAPKVQASLDAISAGAKAVRIINGTDPLAFGNALANKGGTLVVA
jgi:acetylglutamate kinase